MSERDELIQIIWDEAVDDRVKSGKDLRNVPVVRPKVDGMADRILAAGYRKSRTITTPEELEALPSGSVILDSDGEPNVLHDNGWVLPGGPGGYTTWAVAQSLPATVLYEPETP